MKYTVFSVPSVLTGRTIGDVALGEDGRMYAVTLDNAGMACWTCIEDDNITSIIVSLLRTIKWSASMYQNQVPAGTNAANNAADAAVTNANPTKRKKTAYNRHIGLVLTELSKTHPDMARRERMRIAVNSWKDVKKSKLADPNIQDSAFTQRTAPNGTTPVLGDVTLCAGDISHLAHDVVSSS